MAGASEKIATAPCELLEWDSEHFGFPIGRVAGDTLTPERAETIDDWCLDQGIRCLYFLADADDAETARVAAGHGYRVVDIRVTVRHSMEGLSQLPVSPLVTVREADEGELGYLRLLAARSHRGSRFYFDGGFPRERCDLLYEAWVERGFRDPDRTLHVAIVDREPAGYMVFAPLGPEREGHGELGAVDERHRERGVGVALHVAMLRTLASRGAVSHLGVLSARNLAVIRLHETLGFQTERVEVWHHKWYA
jgi:ribosomal protein S18 acetylase RimI-like enzyme